jgi:hypothetical protein
VAPLAGTSGVSFGGGIPVDGQRGHTPFQRYYQTGGDGQSDEAAFEPLTKRELTGRMEASHSPFGFIWQIASQTGWSVHRILWQIPYPALLMMICDAPRHVSADELKRRKRKQGKPVSSKKEGMGALDFFQTRLNNEE